jgi:threonine synthase
MRFYSTNRSVPDVDLKEALLRGQAGDKGLYLPERFPEITRAELLGFRELPYAQIATTILNKYCEGVFEPAAIADLCADAYNYDVPLEHVTGRQHLLRLDQGPTASFKDFAARMMARWMGLLMKSEQGDLVILTATSGDTGSAVAHAYQGLERVHVVVLFPIDEVSNRQRMQMTTLGGNVTTIALNGKFDDCQALVKRAFADPDLGGIRLTSANSINIGRLLPQSVYYVYAYARLADAAQGEPMLVCVPSGNFGNMMGAVIAKRMGVPIRKLIIATNANDEVPIFLRTGDYHKIEPSRVCISNAMNVGHPSNLARLVDVYGGWLDEKGMLREVPDLEALRRDVYAVSITDEQTRTTIKQAYEATTTLLEPHGAVGWAGLTQFLAEHPEHENDLAVCVETAHPAKFPEEVEATIGIVPDLPPSLEGLEQRPEHFGRQSGTYEEFRDFLLGKFAG